jgi:hypothetical protein
MQTNFGIDLNANYRNHSWTPARPSENSPGKELPKPHTDPDVFRPSTPDIYRPSNPHVPGPLPGYPDQPLWLPPGPSEPIIEVPNNFPMEFPYPGQDDWANLPTSPIEIPDWGKMPKHFPGPQGPEIILPNQEPNFPSKTFPDGTWLLS